MTPPEFGACVRKLEQVAEAAAAHVTAPTPVTLGVLSARVERLGLERGDLMAVWGDAYARGVLAEAERPLRRVG